MEIIRHCFMTTALSFSSGASEIQLGGGWGRSGQINELEMSENYKWDATQLRTNVQTPVQTLIINHWGCLTSRNRFPFLFFLNEWANGSCVNSVRSRFIYLEERSFRRLTFFLTISTLVISLVELGIDLTRLGPVGSCESSHAVYKLYSKSNLSGWNLEEGRGPCVHGTLFTKFGSISPRRARKQARRFDSK